MTFNAAESRGQAAQGSANVEGVWRIGGWYLERELLQVLDCLLSSFPVKPFLPQWLAIDLQQRQVCFCTIAGAQTSTNFTDTCEWSPKEDQAKTKPCRSRGFWNVERLRMIVRGLPEQVWPQRAGQGEPPAGSAPTSNPAAGNCPFPLPSRTPVAALQIVPCLHQETITKAYREASSYAICQHRCTAHA